jgi:glycosyltransferase involved in cell wall biosynthesis
MRQTYGRLEILVVDDGSTDATPAVVKAYSTDPRVKYLRQENRGLSAARNIGILHTDGEYIALLDADDFWEPEKLTRQMELFAQYPSCGMVFADYLIFNAQGIMARSRNADHYDGQVNFRQLLTRFNFIYPSTVVIRREVFAQCGYFDESLRAIEDYDMWLRIARKFEIRGMKKTLAHVRVHGTNMSGNIPSMLEYENKVITKHIADLSWIAYRRRLAKNYFLNGDRYIHQGKRAKAMLLFMKGFSYYPFLIVDMTIFLLKFILGGHAVGKLRKRATDKDSLLSKLYGILYRYY